MKNINSAPNPFDYPVKEENPYDYQINKSNKNPYDLEININSILGFLKGWDIIFHGDGRNKYEYAKKVRIKIFSIIGNKNKGKSFILAKIAERDLPNGYSVTTKGLSVSFPNYGNLALLDSVGFESPLLETDGEEYRLKSEQKEKNEEFYQNLNKLEEEIIDYRKRKGKDINVLREKENQFFRLRNDFRDKIEKKDEQLHDLTNERRTTDFFLQRFIIENANVILLVVGKLSIDDQFFLNKLTKLIKDDHSMFLQKIIIIHNLKEMEKKEYVENYIENTLKKSLTFILKEKNDLKLQGERANRDYNKKRYYEEDKESPDKQIIHLIMAKYDTEAGDYYNDSAIDYIRKTGETVLHSKELDLIERLKEYFCKVSETILKFENPNEKIKPKDIKLINENGIDKLKLDYKKKIELETFYGDIFSELSRNPKFIPEYHIISNDDKYVRIYLELSGEIKNFKVDVKFHDNILELLLEGKEIKSKRKL